MDRDFDIAALDGQLESIVRAALELEAQYASEIAATHPEYRDSARNLVHYLALRQADIRHLQEDLATLGLSSLGRAERNVLGSLQAVRQALQRQTTDFGRSREALELRSPTATAWDLGNPNSEKATTCWNTLRAISSSTPRRAAPVRNASQ